MSHVISVILKIVWALEVENHRKSWVQAYLPCTLDVIVIEFVWGLVNLTIGQDIRLSFQSLEKTFDRIRRTLNNSCPFWHPLE